MANPERRPALAAEGKQAIEKTPSGAKHAAEKLITKG
jgi:hypothetical protein